MGDSNNKQRNQAKSSGQAEVRKLNYPRTFLIGFGFFASSLIWSLYNYFENLILGDFIQSTAIIGFIMTVDNIFGVIFQP